MRWTAIDIGTTKICAIIAQTTKEGRIEICGVGKVPSKGLAKAMVIDTEQVVESIKQAVALAESQAQCTADSVYIGISGNHIGSFNSQGVIALKGKEIRQHDISDVIDAAKAIPLKEGQQILHALPQFFMIDGNHLVQNPLHMHGVRLEAHVHIIAGEVAAIQNLISCCEMAGLRVKDIILEPLASAEGTLTTDEKDLGAAILDIGGGTADFAVYHQGTIRHTKIFPIAGNLFTNDLAICLKTTKPEAERIKRDYGCIYTPDQDQKLSLAVQSLDHDHTHLVSTEDIAYVLSARTQELLDMIKAEIKEFNLKPYMAAGLIITGGGSLLKGLDLYAQEQLGIPVRIGHTKLIDVSELKELESPQYATGYGLLVYPYLERKQTLENYQGPMVSKVFSRMCAWVSDLF